MTKSGARYLWAYFCLFLAALGIFSLVTWSVRSIIRADLEKRHQILLSKTVDFCDSLFDEETIAYSETTAEELSSCKEQLDELEDTEEIIRLREYVKDATDYRAWIASADQYIDADGNVIVLAENELVALTDSSKTIAEPYQKLVSDKLTYIRDEFDAMKSATETVNSLFTTADRETVRTDINRQNYNDAKSKVGSLKQADLKSELAKALENVLASVEKEEQLARERAEAARRAEAERQKKIAESWSQLNLSPYYINQHSAGVDNGCEAASLLMALRYKGYLRGADFRTFALNMPTSSDPNQGFYLSMTDLEPREEAHWIAPGPLAVYGASASGATILNATGWSLDRLDQEVKSGNPVVIYLTYNFNNPKTYSKGVPKNLHVVVLSGYNSYTGDQQFYDPWPVGSPNPILSKSRTEYLYAASGYRALVVK